MRMVKVLLDTNFLVYCAKQKIDYLGKIRDLISGGELIVFSSIIDELKKLSDKAGKASDKQAAELALKILKKYIKKKEIKVLETKKSADKAILEAAKSEVVVATADRILKKKLKKKARILSIRQKRDLKLG